MVPFRIDAAPGGVDADSELRIRKREEFEQGA
jgi:hypothetical protein